MIISDSLRKIVARGACLVACLVTAAAFGAKDGMTAYGADSSVIEKVTVTLKSSYGEPDQILEPEITVSGTGCSLEDFQYMTNFDKWKPGKKVRIEITVAAAEGKVFPTSLNHSQCKVTGADFVSARSLEDDKLQVKVDYKPVMVLGNTEDAGWSNTHASRAVWKAVENAPGYSLILYGDNKSVKRLTVTSTAVDLGEYMTDDEKTYYYEVKAIPISSDEKKYLKEGEFIASTANELDWYEIMDTSDGGGIKGNNYILPNGQKDVNTWKRVSNQWYYFDQNGDMVKGWRYINGYWYYMASNGVMRTGWINPSGDTWFYANENGEMQTGWVQPAPSTWYYMDGSGYMQRGWVLVNGKWYFLDTSGKMRTGWVQVGGIWYYLFGDGSMAQNTVIDGWIIDGSGAARPQ